MNETDISKALSLARQGPSRVFEATGEDIVDDLPENPLSTEQTSPPQNSLGIEGEQNQEIQFSRLSLDDANLAQPVPGPVTIDVGCRDQDTQCTSDSSTTTSSSHGDARISPGHDPTRCHSRPHEMLEQEIEPEDTDTVEGDLLTDPRAGCKEGPQYTVHEVFRDVKQARSELPSSLYRQILDMWWNDNWNHLVDPPSWLKINHFVAAIPAEVGNSEAFFSLQNAYRNLSLTRILSKDPFDEQELIHFLRTMPSFDSGMLNRLCKAVEGIQKWEVIAESLLNAAVQNTALTETLMGEFLNLSRTLVQLKVHLETLFKLNDENSPTIEPRSV